MRQHPWLERMVVEKGVSTEVNAALDVGKKVLIEGTQGFGLSLYHSENYPRSTSRDTTASGFLSEVGISPRMVTEIVVVLRTFPIRVAGQQAGPLREEITWEQLRAESGYPHVIEERTTVTNKLRRVARFDWELGRTAIAINRPTRVAINGLDYLDYRNRGVVDFDSLTDVAKVFVERLKTSYSCDVSYLGTGPQLDQVFSGTNGLGETLHMGIAR